MSLSLETVDETQKLRLELRLKQLEKLEACQSEFIPFVRSMWPGFIAGRHHYIIAEKLEEIASGKLKRLIINMPPRHTKSEFASFLFPAWMMGRDPSMKIIQATHTTEPAVRSRTFWKRTSTMIFLKGLSYQQIVRHRADGTQNRVVCTMPWALVRTWRAVVVI